MSKTNNTAKKALLEAEEVVDALKEGTKKSLSEMVGKAIQDIILEEEEKPEDEEVVDVPATEPDEDEYEEEDVKTDDDSEASDGEEVSSEEEVDVEETPAEEDDEWSDMEDYKVGDDEYDLTGADDDEVLKVYNKLGDDDNIVVRKTDDGEYEIKDEETGAEYVLDIDLDAAAEAEEPAEEPEEAEVDVEVDGEEVPEEGDEEDALADLDIEIVDDEDEEEPLNETELGYTETYQKDVMPGLNMNEPADAKSTRKWDKGAPEGNKRPYSGLKGADSTPFNKPVNECGDVPVDEPTIEEDVDEATNVGGAVQQHSAAKSNIPSGRKEHGPKVKHHVSAAGDYNEEINESIKKLQMENKEYEKCLKEIKKNLYEAFVTNVKLGHILKLVCENTTSDKEKQSIVERFEKVETLKESKMLFDSIQRELKESVKTAPVLEHTLSIEPKKALNETTIYSKETNPALDLMSRMNNLWKN